MDTDNDDSYILIAFAVTESFPDGLPPMKDINSVVEKYCIFLDC